MSTGNGNVPSKKNSIKKKKKTVGLNNKKENVKKKSALKSKKSDEKDSFSKQFDDFEESADNNSSCEEDYSDDCEEGYEGYKYGGYHPVNIGDKFNARYTVVEKLGWGHFSTVWMSFDKKASSIDSPEFVALKIQKSAPHYREAALDEIELLNCVATAATSENVILEYGPNYDNCLVRLLDYFNHTGVHGKHVCMTFEMLGENLLKVIKKYDYRGIPIPVVKNFVRQICVGLDFMHRHCSIIHTDLKPENILVCTPQSQLTKSDIKEVLAAAETQKNKINFKKLKKLTSPAIINSTTSFMEHSTLTDSAEPKLMTTEQKKKLKKKIKEKKTKRPKN